MITPKFQIGDTVEKIFNSDVEGVPVEVRKRLFVVGVYVYQSSVNTDIIICRYKLSERFPDKCAVMNNGRVYENVEEDELLEVEALVNESRKVTASESTTLQTSTTPVASNPGLLSRLFSRRAS